MVPRQSSGPHLTSRRVQKAVIRNGGGSCFGVVFGPIQTCAATCGMAKRSPDSKPHLFKLHAIDGRFADPSQYASAKLAARRRRTVAHRMRTLFNFLLGLPPAFFGAKEHTPGRTQTQSRLNPAHRTWKIPRRESLTTPPKPFAPMIKSDSKSLGASWLKEP